MLDVNWHHVLLEAVLEKPNLHIIWDIDSTLFDVSGRHQSIFNALAKKSQDPQVSEVAANIRFQPLEFGYQDALKRHSSGLSRAQEEEIELFWQKEFFSDRHLKADIPYPRAAKTLSGLNSLGFDQSYLTGRHRQSMHDETTAMLAKHGFPPLKLITKEDPKQSDVDYKVSQVTQILRHKSSVLLIDNEPCILNALIGYKNVALLLFDSCHSGRENPDASLKRFQKFPDLSQWSAFQRLAATMA